MNLYLTKIWRSYVKGVKTLKQAEKSLVQIKPLVSEWLKKIYT